MLPLSNWKHELEVPGSRTYCGYAMQRIEVRVMSPTTVLIAMAALLATSLSLKAEGSKLEESQAEQPYTDQLGDNQVTSVKREITKGGGLGGLSREELLQAAREALPINVFPSDPTPDTKPDEQR
jgi:hypothetical protein